MQDSIGFSVVCGAGNTETCLQHVALLSGTEGPRSGIPGGRTTADLAKVGGQLGREDPLQMSCHCLLTPGLLVCDVPHQRLIPLDQLSINGTRCRQEGGLCERDISQKRHP